jgi:hypothetical protein
VSIQTNQLHRRVWIDPPEREGLARVLDVVVPGTETLPSGRSVAAHEDLLDHVVSADSRLEAPLKQVGKRAADAESFILDDVVEWAGEHAEEVVFALTAAYYMAAEVRELLNYPGQRRLPIAQATPDEVVSDDLLAPVRERGEVFVPTPDGD